MCQGKIPVIDLECKGGVTESWLKEVADKLSHAFSTTGCAFLVNHGISEHSLKSLNEKYDEFNALPDDIKNKYKRTGDSAQGYISGEDEKLYGGDDIKEIKSAYQLNNPEGRLPTEVSHFRDAVRDVSDEFLNVTKTVLRIYSTSLGVDPEVFLRFFEGMMIGDDNFTSLRVILYPGVKDQEIDNITRCEEHTDYGPFTLLTQDTDGGLEVMIDNEWVKVEYPPGALLAITADISESWTDSKFKALKHRVTMPEDPEQRARDRHSIILFVYPDHHTPIGPSFLAKCRTGSLPNSTAQGDEMTASEYCKMKWAEFKPST